jgi:hypothetical protein
VSIKGTGSLMDTAIEMRSSDPFITHIGEAKELENKVPCVLCGTPTSTRQSYRLIPAKSFGYSGPPPIAHVTAPVCKSHSWESKKACEGIAEALKDAEKAALFDPAPDKIKNPWQVHQV